MKNQLFLLQSEEEKERKLCTALRNRTNNVLSNSELRDMSLSVTLGRQYVICVHTDPIAFCNALRLGSSDTWSERGRIVFGQALFALSPNLPGLLFQENRPAGVIVTRSAGDEARTVLQATIHIYIPEDLYQKGAAEKHEQRA